MTRATPQVHNPPSPVQRLRSALPVFSPPPKPKPAPVRVEVVETQASAARESYLAERLAQIDGWEYNQKPWGPAEMPVPASLPFGRDPRGRVRRRVESVMREVGTGGSGSGPKPAPELASAPVSAPPKSAHGAEVGKHDEPQSPTRAKTNRLAGTKRWSMMSLKAAAQEPPAPAQAASKENRDDERGPPSAFRRWSVIKPSGGSDGHGHAEPTLQEPKASQPSVRPSGEPSTLKKNRRWSIQSLKDVLARDRDTSAHVDAARPETTIITHLPERTSSIASPAKDAKKRMTMTTTTHSTSDHTIPSPTLSLVSLDIDFDIFGLSSDSQSVKTPPPDEQHSNPEPAERAPGIDVSVSDTAASYASASDAQLLAERDAWRHEALLLYDQLCYWRLEALERGRERDGWRGAALAAGVQVPPSVTKQMPTTMAPVPVTETQRREKHIEREREKGRERVREWHLASIERERQEHEAREAERRYAEVAGVTAERRRERRAAEKRGIERREMERREYARREHERRRSRVGQQPEWAGAAWGGPPAGSAVPGGVVSAAAADAAAASVTPPALVVDSWGKQQPGRRVETPRASGWPASESGRERARELLVGGGWPGVWSGTWPRRSGTA